MGKRKDSSRIGGPTKLKNTRSTIVKIGKDFKRVIDYLETRENLDIEKTFIHGI
jgi:hypothetical protein